MVIIRENKEKTIKLDELTKEQKLKYEIAKELGLYDKVIEEGWKSLSAKETGRIGGLINRRKKQLNQAASSEKDV